MGHKEKTLEDLIALADERIATLRGLQKDWTQNRREITEAIAAWKHAASTQLHDALETIVNARLHEMYAHVENTEAHAIRVVADRLTSGFDILFDQAFGTRDPEEIKAGIRVIRAVTEQLNENGWEPRLDVVAALLHSTVEGLYGVEQVRHDGTIRRVGETLRGRLGTPPHASVQDEPSRVG